MEDLGAILRSQRVQAELYEFESWFKRYGEHVLAHEESKLVVRAGWLARVMLDEGYSMFPGREAEVKEFVSRKLAEELASLGVDARLVRRGELHGTRPDVVEVLLRVFPNVRQTERPSLTAILESEQAAGRPKPAAPRAPANLGEPRLEPLLALLATLLVSSALIVLLARYWP